MRYVPHEQQLQDAADGLLRLPPEGLHRDDQSESRAVRVPDELRHLHKEYAQQSYLLSYWQRLFEGRRYLVVAWHDIGRIVRETLPTLASDAPSAAHEATPVSHSSAASRVATTIHAPTTNTATLATRSSQIRARDNRAMRDITTA